MTLTPEKNIHFLTADNIPVPHAFCTRAGGISPVPFDSLNLGLSSGDTETHVNHNRKLALAKFGSTQANCCTFHQIHSNRVLIAQPTFFTEEADASVTDDPNLTLIVSTADCLPIMFYDPTVPAIGVAHCGWRGTVSDLARAVLEQLHNNYGCEPANVQVAIGPGISQTNFQVGQEVIGAFIAGGFSEEIYYPDKDFVDGEPRYRLDLALANRQRLEQQGVKNIWQSPHCTYRDSNLFYSYRREKGVTGRHWNMIKLA